MDRNQKRLIVVAAAFAAAALIAVVLFLGAWWISLFPDSSDVAAQPVEITYEIVGDLDAHAASVTYEAAPGSTQQEARVALPWTQTVVISETHQFLYVSAQNKDDSGCVTARIRRGAAVLKESRSCGPYVIASATERY